MLSEIKKIFTVVLFSFFALSGKAQVDIVSGGTGAAYTITFPGVLSSYVWGTTFTFRAHIANTGACTIDVNGLGPVTIKNTAGSNLAANDILANQVVTITYDFNGNFQMTSASGNIVSGTPLTGTGSVGRVAKWNSVNTFTASSLIYDNGMSVGLGTSNTLADFHVQSSNTNSVTSVAFYNASGDNEAPKLNLVKSRGNYGSPSSVLNGDALGALNFVGYDGASFWYSASIKAHAAENWSTGANGSYIAISTTSVGSASPTEVIRITAGGVGIGTSSVSSTYKLEVNGLLRSNGIEETSDKRYKKDIVTINDPVKKVLGLRGVTYNWRTEEFKDRNFTERLQMGLIAQEVEQVIPEVVMTDDNGWKSVEYSKLVALLIEAIKE